MVTTKRGSHAVTRNVSFFKKISGLQNDTSAEEDESDDDDVRITSGQSRQEQDCQEPLAHENRRETEDNPIDSDFEQTKIRTTNIVYLHYCMVTAEIILVDSP